MLNQLLRPIFLSTLSLRYRITVRNLAAIKSRGNRGILFLPTHPALIDPMILGSVLLKDFQVRPFSDQDAVDRPGVRWLAAHVRSFIVPSIARHGQSAASRIEALMGEVVEALRQGDNVVLYPAGSTQHTRHERLGANSGVETILRALPDVRVVLVKTRGLWGSRFSRIKGRAPEVGPILLDAVGQILSNFVFFTPRRPVELSFFEPDDLPRQADRTVLNAYLESFYNHDAPPATYVPYTLWEGGQIRELPDPERAGPSGNLGDVSPATRSIVLAHLHDVTGATNIQDSDLLTGRLGMDSLARAELLAWIESEFGFPQGNADSLQTVADVLLAASGEALAVSEDNVKPPLAAWFAADADGTPLSIGKGESIPACFLECARQAPGSVIVADQRGGLRTRRDLITGVLALLPAVQALPGERVGIMLPASVAALMAWLTVMFAGRTPVMVNWTTGKRSLAYGLELTGTERVITAKPMLARLQKQGLDLTDLQDRFVFLEEMAAGLTRWSKLRAFLGSRLGLHRLGSAHISETAAILFTSGSESLPKAVPLTHANILADMRDVLTYLAGTLTRRDKMLAMLPPFHSFGLAANLTLPLITGVRAVFHPNPTEGPLLAETLEAYRATVAVGTPTFLNGILRSATAKQLATLRIGLVGAEECPKRVYELIAERCPQFTVLEGYGITECSPVVAFNIPGQVRPHSLGRFVPSLEYVLVDVDSGQPISEPGKAGLLLLRGPTIFGGYLGEAPDPFVEHAGKRWYRTGDLVRLEADGILWFAGRLKRFVKLGGEMISLPAIESVLQAALGTPEDEGPAAAVVATGEEYPELVLFTPKLIDREAANLLVRAAGFSGLHNLRRVERVAAIPVLGTGKTDYRTLQAMLAAL